MRSLNLFFFSRDEKGRLAVFEMVDEWKYLLCIEKWWWEKNPADSHEQQHIDFFPLSFLFVIKTVALTTAMLPRPFQQTLFQPLHLCYQHFSTLHCIYLIVYCVQLLHVSVSDKNQHALACSFPKTAATRCEFHTTAA